MKILRDFITMIFNLSLKILVFNIFNSNSMFLVENDRVPIFKLITGWRSLVL